MSWKIIHPLVKGTIKEVGENIYAVQVKDQYDRAMLFCRYQEFYESPYKKYKNKFFTLTDYMRYYTKQRNSGTFTYTEDWSGYNIPSHILEKALDKFIYKDYMTEYDKLMNEIFTYCELKTFAKENVRKKFYLLGVENLNDDTFKHELAHGLYYTNNEYKKNCDILISNIKKRHYNFVRKVLIRLGYSNDDKIINDEIQAYFSTGLHDKFDGDDIREYQKPFIENFKKYSGKQKKEKTRLSSLG